MKVNWKVLLFVIGIPLVENTDATISLKDSTNLAAMCTPPSGFLPLSSFDQGLNLAERAVLVGIWIGDRNLADSGLKDLEKIPENDYKSKSYYLNYKNIVQQLSPTESILNKQTKKVFDHIFGGQYDEAQKEIQRLLSGSNKGERKLAKKLELALYLHKYPGALYSTTSEHVLMTNDEKVNLKLLRVVDLIAKTEEDELKAWYRALSQNNPDQSLMAQLMFAHLASGKVKLAARYARHLQGTRYVNDAKQVIATRYLCSEKVEEEREKSLRKAASILSQLDSNDPTTTSTNTIQTAEQLSQKLLQNPVSLKDAVNLLTQGLKIGVSLTTDFQKVPALPEISSGKSSIPPPPPPPPPPLLWEDTPKRKFAHEPSSNKIPDLSIKPQNIFDQIKGQNARNSLKTRVHEQKPHHNDTGDIMGFSTGLVDRMRFKQGLNLNPETNDPNSGNDDNDDWDDDGYSYAQQPRAKVYFSPPPSPPSQVVEEGNWKVPPKIPETYHHNPGPGPVLEKQAYHPTNTGTHDKTKRNAGHHQHQKIAAATNTTPTFNSNAVSPYPTESHAPQERQSVGSIAKMFGGAVGRGQQR